MKRKNKIKSTVNDLDIEVLLSLSKEPVIMLRSTIHKQKENFSSFFCTIMFSPILFDISQADTKMLK